MAERFIPFKARKRGAGPEEAEVQVPLRFTLDEAARAIALEYPSVPRRFGAMTCQRALRDAATKGLANTRQLAKADPDMVTFYRGKLIELAIFPPDATEGGDSAD